MVVSRIINNGIVYYCLNAEIKFGDIIIRKEIVDPDISNNLMASHISSIFEDIKKNLGKYSKFVLDGENLEKINDNFFGSVLQKFDKKNAKILYRDIQTIDGLTLSNIGSDDSVLDLKTVFENAFFKKLKGYTEEISELPHSFPFSSLVKISRYINIKKFIEKDRAFVLYSIYRLARKMQEHQDKEGKKWEELFKSEDKPILVCQSFNGSFIASVLSTLLGLDMFMIDGVGPINKLYRNIGATIEAKKKYIVVSDVVCLGTEVKITKNIIEYLGGIYLGNVSIVRMKPIEEKKYDDVECVFEINKDNNKVFGYTITTDLTNENR